VLGEWADEDYTVACMHAVDYRIIGGYNLSAANFQYDLYQRHVASGLQVDICYRIISYCNKDFPKCMCYTVHPVAFIDLDYITLELFKVKKSK